MLRSVLIKLTVQIGGATFLNSRANEKVRSTFLQIKSSDLSDISDLFATFS